MPETTLPNQSIVSDRSMHLVLRLPAGGMRLGVLIEKHNAVIQKHGAVWMGIRTCSLGERLRAPLSWQIKNSIPTFIYLLQRSGNSFEGYKGSLGDSTNYLRPGMEGMTPQYYSEDQLVPDFKGWIQITSFTPVKERELLRLAMYTTGTQLVYVLRKSMLSFGSVYIADHEFPMRQETTISKWGRP